MKKQCLLCDIPDCSLESDEDIRECPIHKCLSVIGKKRTLIVLLVLERPMRFGELKRAIPDITEKVLLSTLHRLEEVGYIAKEKVEGKHPRATYQISESGKKIVVVAREMAEIGKGL